MSSPEREMPPRREGVLRFGVPNESSPDQILAAASRITGHLFEGAVFREPDYVVGTIVTLTISITGIRDLKPREKLTPQELVERDFVAEFFHDFDFERE